MNARRGNTVKGMGRILLRVLAGAFALVMALSLLSFYYNDPCPPFSQGQMSGTIQNLCGLFGAYLAGFFQTLVGVGAWLIPVYVLWECFPTTSPKWYQRLAWLPLALALWTTLGAFGSRSFPALDGLSANQWRWGGWLGSSLWLSCRKALGPIGLPLVLVTLALVSTLILAPALTRALGRLLLKWMGDKAWPWLRPLPSKGARGFLGMVQRPFLLWRARTPAPDLDAQDMRELTRIGEQQRVEEEQVEALNRAERQALQYKKANRQGLQEAELPVIHSMRLDTPSEVPPFIDSLVINGERNTPAETLPPPALLRNLPPPPPPKPLLVEPVVVQDRFGRRVEQQPLGLTEPTPARPLPDLERLGTRVEPVKHSPAPAHSSEPAWGPVDRLELPPRRIFDPPQPEHKLDPVLLESTKELIGQKLTEFKVKGQMVGMQPGPVVTVYEFQPDPGVPLAKVLGMEEDLALGLQAEKVRIDRIPGRNLVGIEVPNQYREVISFREIVDSPQFRDPSQKDARSLLTLALGKDMAGHPVVADLGKMPHLLIGGSTGSGKSVGVNAMICSLLLRALPSEVKLILVDPKMVELGVYEDIPHLWAPVVTDMKEAGRILKWVVAQMEDRYKRLAMLSVRNLEGFNAKLLEAGGTIDLSDRTPNPRWLDRPAFLEPLPYVVVVIDELADLMMVCRAEVEESIARIAQKARAVGIHLVLATQRPSVDIVTGVIKANLPARLSYRVNTKIDSRTILDGSGGEQLLGKGDALFLAPGNARPRRIHAPLITEEEILRLVEWLKEHGRPDFNQALLNAMATDEEAASQSAEEGPSGGGDDIYDRAVAVVRRERKASTSLLQRKLNIGYGRAARIIDRMEEEGIIGQDRGAGKPREVLVGEE
jgi:DNA segregation ATPase FtsK/SpoIIIE, S-DNA-T family